MPRPCTVCLHPELPDIAADLANGVNAVQIAKRYGLARSPGQRPPQHVGAGRPPEPSPPRVPLNSVDAARRTGRAFQALASLPSLEEVGAAYSSIGARIDAIAEKAERDGSLAVALMGLKELRSTVTAQAQLAGHVGSGAPVQVHTQVNVDMGAPVKEFIAALRPRPDPTIPRELAAHLEGVPPDAGTLKRLEA